MAQEEIKTPDFILLQTLEAEGMAKVNAIKNNKGTDLLKEVEAILKNGTAAFEEAMCRPMTYSELREAYG